MRSWRPRARSHSSRGRDRGSAADGLTPRSTPRNIRAAAAAAPRPVHGLSAWQPRRRRGGLQHGSRGGGLFATANAPQVMDAKGSVRSVGSLTPKGTEKGRYQFKHEGRLIYEWDQNLEDVTLYVTPPPGVTPDMIDCVLTPSHMKLGLRGNPPFLDEPTGAAAARERNRAALRRRRGGAFRRGGVAVASLRWRRRGGVAVASSLRRRGGVAAAIVVAASSRRRRRGVVFAAASRRHRGSPRRRPHRRQGVALLHGRQRNNGGHVEDAQG